MRWILYAYEASLDLSSYILQMFLSTLVPICHRHRIQISVSYTNTSPFCSRTCFVLLAGLLNYW